MKIKRETATDLEAQEIEDLERRIKQITPLPGRLSLKEDEVKFNDFPISKLTLKGLTRGNFTIATEIQKQALPHALAGRDILGAAKTGSGKTLAFLIPLVEDLFRQQWSKEDGIGGLVISPTRELALQIYEVLRVLLYGHAFTGGLLVGGTDFSREQKSALKLQIVIGTPGRILQHLEQTPNFEFHSTLRVLVLDEADRLLDLGFQDQLESILSYTPKPRSLKSGIRQTMLFSATQTKSVKDLAKLSLTDPEFISVHSKETQATPENLKQSYVICELGEKINMIYSFIHTHLQTKMIVFFSSCKQVKFLDVVFRRLRLPIPILALHGKQSAVKRTFVYSNFCNRPHACLLATDVAARGLDFPNVDWVLQADCPEDASTYIHRVGRTARYTKGGNALLVLLPSEEKSFLSSLKDSRVPMKKLNLNPQHRKNIKEKIVGLLVADPDLKVSAQKAFKSYLRSINLQTNRDVFDIKKLSFKEFAASLGLPSVPRIRFNQGGETGRKELRTLKNQNHGILAIENEEKKKHNLEDDDDDDDEEDDEDIVEEEEKKTKGGKWERMLKRKPKASRMKQDDSEEEEDDEPFEPILKKTNTKVAQQPVIEQAIVSKAKQQKAKPLKINEGGFVKGQKNHIQEFDDDAEMVDPFAQITKEKSSQGAHESFVKRISEKLKKEDVVDRETQRKRIKEKHKDEKVKKKAKKEEVEENSDDEDKEEQQRVVLGHSSDNDEEMSDLEEAALKFIERS